MKKQLKFEVGQEAEARTAAIAMSADQNDTGYAAIIKSNDKLFVENEPTLIRTWETMIGEYEAGELIDLT